MVNRISALTDHIQTGAFGAQPATITMRLNPQLSLYQIAAWPNTLASVTQQLTQTIKATTTPSPNQAVNGTKGTLFQVEPLKCWLLDAPAPTLDADQGAVLDLSHARTWITLSGETVPQLLNRHLSLDLRPHSFPVNAVAASGIHHVGVTLWHSDEQTYELFIPRSFALATWEILLESALPFGFNVEIKSH